MGTFLKYLFYLLLIVVLYIVIRGFFNGDINRTTTIGEVASQVSSGTKELASDAADGVEYVIDDSTQARQRQ